MAGLVRNRDFMPLWSGQVVSTLGTRISGLAYPLLVLAVVGVAIAVVGTVRGDLRHAPRVETLTPGP